MLADLYRLPRSMSTLYKNGECIMIYYFLYPHFLGGFALSEVTNAGPLVKSIAILAIVRVVFFIIVFFIIILLHDVDALPIQISICYLSITAENT